MFGADFPSWPRTGCLELRAHTALVIIRPQRFWGLGLRRGQHDFFGVLSGRLQGPRHCGVHRLQGDVDVMLTTAAN